MSKPPTKAKKPKRTEHEWPGGTAYWLDTSNRAHDPGLGHAVCGAGDQPDRVRVFSKREALRYNVDPYSRWRDLGPPPPKPQTKRKKATKSTAKRTPSTTRARPASSTVYALSLSSAPVEDHLPPPPPAAPDVGKSSGPLGAGGAPPPGPPGDGPPPPTAGGPTPANHNAGPQYVYDAEPTPPTPPPPQFTPEQCMPQAMLMTSMLARFAQRGTEYTAPPRPDEIKAMAEAICQVMNRRAAIMGGYDDLIALASISAGVYIPRAAAAAAVKKAQENPQKENKKVAT